MADIWFISDTHMYHNNVLRFVDHQGRLTRGDRFTDISEMNQYIVDRWNSTVKPKDKVYHLGDVTFQYHESFHQLMRSLHGKKRLVLGNHDKIQGTGLLQHFEKVMLWWPARDLGFTASHIPLRLDQMRTDMVNIHGHVHQNSLTDPCYINVSCEVRDYTPVHIEELRKEFPCTR